MAVNNSAEIIIIGGGAAGLMAAAGAARTLCGKGGKKSDVAGSNGNGRVVVPEKMQRKRVVALDMARVVAGTQYRGHGACNRSVDGTGNGAVCGRNGGSGGCE
jgi:glycine/D-amino acid oxidase-like deaminating enzyme